MKNTLFTFVAAICLISSLVLIQGCGRKSSSSSTNYTTNKTTTTGQELIDLQKAYNQGVISQKEFERQKEQILEKK